MQPSTHVALLVVSGFGVALAIISAHSRGSTSAIALLFVPLYLLVMDGIVGFVLLCRKDKQ